MWELRWVLLVLGVLFIAGLYLWGQGVLSRLRISKASPASRVREDPLPEEAPVSSVEPESPEGADRSVDRTDRIITIRFIPKDGELSCEQAVLALRKAGLQHGRYGVFHRFDEREESLFYVANLTEPGSFDLTNLADKTIPGMSFFMVLPGSGDPVTQFDLMVQTARSLAHDLNAELHDEKGSSWSIQRERYVREEIIRYRHQLECASPT